MRVQCTRATYLIWFLTRAIPIWLLLSGCLDPGDPGAGAPPSVLVIEARDVGLSDIGAYGSEIHTPHLDSLAGLGLRFTDFYDNQADTGDQITERLGCVNALIPDWPTSEPLGTAGYRIYKAGTVGEVSVQPQTTLATREAQTLLERHVHDHPDAPFLLHVVLSPMSSGLQSALPESDRYDGRYAPGWEKLRRERFARMLALGVIDERYVLPPAEASGGPASYSPADAAWMEQYAARIERMDFDIGQLLTAVRDRYRQRPMLVLFVGSRPEQDHHARAENAPAGWHYASSTPYRRQPGSLFEGALKRPLIAYWPGEITRPGHVSRHVSHFGDVAATVMAFAGLPSTGTATNANPCGSRAESLDDAFRGLLDARQDTLYWATRDGAAMRMGSWKLIGRLQPPEQWMLFDLSSDPTEMHDLSGSAVDRVAQLRAEWLSWSSRNTSSASSP